MLVFPVLIIVFSQVEGRIIDSDSNQAVVKREVHLSKLTGVRHSR